MGRPIRNACTRTLSPTQTTSFGPGVARENHLAVVEDGTRSQADAIG